MSPQTLFQREDDACSSVTSPFVRARRELSYTIWPMRFSLHRFGSVHVSLIALALVLGGHQEAPALLAQQHPSTITAGPRNHPKPPKRPVVFFACAHTEGHPRECWR